MPNFKDPAGNLHFLDDAAFSDLLPAGSVQITDAEADVLRAPTVSQIVTTKWLAIKAERDRRKAGGIKVKVGTTDKWFHSDDASRIQQMGLVIMGTSIPASLQWKTMDGTFVTMDRTVVSNVFAAAAASDQAIFDVAETHKAAMEASADPSAYDFSTGWPKIYGE
jgi:hypothetical protein